MQYRKEKPQRIFQLNEYFDYDIKRQKFIARVDAIPLEKREFSFDDMIRTSNDEKKAELKRIMKDFCEKDHAFVEKGSCSNMRARIENALIGGLKLGDAIRFMDTNNDQKYLVPRRKNRII